MYYCVFSVTKSIGLELKSIVSLTLVRDDVVVVCGIERRMEWIKAYVLHTGEELESFTAPGACAVARCKTGWEISTGNSLQVSGWFSF